MTTKENAKKYILNLIDNDLEVVGDEIGYLSKVISKELPTPLSMGLTSMEQITRKAFDIYENSTSKETAVCEKIDSTIDAKQSDFNG